MPRDDDGLRYEFLRVARASVWYACCVQDHAGFFDDLPKFAEVGSR
jgi:hypothetical protein